MKNFLTSVKGKIIAGVGTVVVVAGVITAAIFLNSGYRTIVVNELNGITNIINNSKTNEAYVGLHLISGDDVTVTKNSDLTLALDDDKYVFAEEETHFWIEAKGKLNDTRTDIYMDEGSNLFRIDNKLNEEEEFIVDTPNATMSVRGTVFRVSLRTDDNGDKYTLVEVLEGEVYVEAKYELGEVTGENRLLAAGDSAIIRSNNSISEFVKTEDGKTVMPIDYAGIPQKTARKLGIAIDDGRNLSITKELLFDLVAINDHVFEAEEEMVDATCDEPGYYYEVCAVCGEKEKVEIPKLEHEYYEEKYIPDDCSSEWYIIRKCKLCDEEIKTEIESNGHIFEDKWIIEKKPTCTEPGIQIRKCLNCGNEEKEEIKQLGHEFGLPVIIQNATENQYGLVGRICIRCQAVDNTMAVVIEKKQPVQAPEVPHKESSNGNEEKHEDSHVEEYPEPAVPVTPVAPATPTTPPTTPPPPTPQPSHTHSWGVNRSGTYIAPTCTSTGSQDEICSDCLDTRTVVLPVVSHDMTAWTQQAVASHILERSCNYGCGQIELHDMHSVSDIIDNDGDGACDLNECFVPDHSTY